MVKSKLRTRIIALAVTIVIILTSFVSSLVSAFVVSDSSILLSSVSADSNDRRRALINFARNKSLSDMTEDGLESLTNEDLTMIGVYLSNFYVPWSTSIQGGTEEHEESVKKMVDALVACNFDKDVAQALVEMVFKLSEDTHENLQVKYSEGCIFASDDARWSQQNTSGVMTSDATWLLFLYLTGCNRAHPLFISYDDDITLEFYPYGSADFYWTDSDGKCHTVFKINSDDYATSGVRDYSASLLQYSNLSTHLCYKNGLAGNALFTLDKSELKNYTTDEITSCYIGGAPLSVDCFGNIICDCGTAAYIVIPAAANPYLWKETGDAEDDTAGSKINGVNLYNIGLYAEGRSKYISGDISKVGYPLYYGGKETDFATGDVRRRSGDETEDCTLGVLPDTEELDDSYEAASASNCHTFGDSGSHYIYFNSSAGQSPSESIYGTRLFSVVRGDSATKIDTKWFKNDDDEVAMSDFLKSMSIKEGDFGIDTSLHTNSASGFFRNDVNKRIMSALAKDVDNSQKVMADSDSVIDEVIFMSWMSSYKLTNDVYLSYHTHLGSVDVSADTSTKGYITNGGNLALVEMPTYTDLIMINTLGDLDAVADLYGTSVTDTPEPAEEVELSTSELHDRAESNYEVIRDKMSVSGVTLTRNFSALWQGLIADLVDTGRPTATTTSTFMGYVDWALNGKRIPHQPTGSEDNQAMMDIRSDLIKLRDVGIDSDTWKTFCGSLDVWRGDAAYASESAISDTGSTSRTSDMLVVKSIFNEDGTLISEYSSGMGSFYSGNKFNDIKGSNDNAIASLPSGVEKAYAVSIYLSYVYAYFGGDENPLSWEYNAGNFPEITGSPDWGDIEVDVTDERLSELQSMFYYIAHPSEGVEYIKVWFKNKIGGILSGWHEDMAGSSHTTATTGTTRYVGFMGYVTTPQLTDLSWTDWLLNQYDSLIIYFVILMMVILLLYVLVGTLSLQKAIAGVFIFAICAFLPPKAINVAVDTSNRVCDSIYGSKFTYWALVQHEQYVGRITEAVSSGSNDQYLSTIFSTQVDNASDDYAIVTVKWMCPKKDNYMANIERQLIRDTGDSHAFRLISGLVNKTVSGEDYLDSADSLYLYRSYTDISAYANHGYKRTKLKADTIDEGYISETTADFTGTSVSWDTYLQNYNIMGIPMAGSEILGDSGYYSAYKGMALGFEPDLRTAADVNKKEQLRYFAMLNSTPLDRAVAKGLSADVELNDLSTSPDTIEGTLAGISQRDMDFGLHDISTISDDELTLGTMSTSQIPDFVYANYTESPYYYFSYNLYDQLSKAATWSENPATDYKSLFLAGEDKSYFYNMTDMSSYGDTVSTESGGYGQMRDYMDMRSLFCVVIPRLKQANDVVVAWDNTYGLTLYDDVPIKYTPDGKFDMPTEVTEAGVDSELAYKYWHNANVVQLFNMYTPWVDTMYDCDYAKPETIMINGEKFEVEDPLNPYSYYEFSGGSITAGRPMIFSRSEMDYFGLTEKDLTTVEKKILEVQDNSYESLLQLMDYYNFNEEVLNTGAAMLETFEFNKTFSQTSVVGEDYILYPQSYELKNFSYDAYLRLMLANSTGESITEGVDSTSLNKTGSFYQNVVNNSSILTGIMLVVVDLFAVYAVPTLKIFFVVLIFILSILVILAASVSLEIRIQEVLMKSLVLPLLKYLGISIGMAFVVSLFMSDGNTAVTNRKSVTISLGDPVMLLIAMLVINAGVLILYAKLCKGVWDDAKKYFQAVGSSIVGTFGGALAKISGAVMAGKEKITSSVSTGTEGGSASQSRTSLSESVRTPRAIGSGVGAVAGAGAAAAVVNSKEGRRSNSKDIGTSARVRRSPNDVSFGERMSNIKTAKANKYDAKVEMGRIERERKSVNAEYKKAQSKYKADKNRVKMEKKGHNGRASLDAERALLASKSAFDKSKIAREETKYEHKSSKARYSSAKAENRSAKFSLGKKRPRNGNK